MSSQHPMSRQGSFERKDRVESVGRIESRFHAACECFEGWGVDVSRALELLQSISLSLHCWQGDDVGGFESTRTALGDGLAVTGNYPGKARTPDELRTDLEWVYSQLPGKHRLNLHAFYGEFGGERVDRDAIELTHFQGWIEWAREHGLGLDFNPTFFSHPLAKDGFTLSHRDPSIRAFWIEHGRRSRRIGAAMGHSLGRPCITNIWIPDGFKDTPVDRAGPRQRLIESLDEVLREELPRSAHEDAVEAKLFGIGSESYTTGSHEFYLGYAVRKQIRLCLDAGHFHPTESIADKISSVQSFVPGILLHLSRGVRWDSDHVVIWNDDLLAITAEVVRGGYLQRTALGLDFFDASINRLAAWVIGARNVLKAFLVALLEPIDRLRVAEEQGNYTQRLALQEEFKMLPFGAIWDYHCLRNAVPVGLDWLGPLEAYESKVLSKRN